MRWTTSSTKSTGADRVRDGVVVAVALLTVTALAVAGSVGVAAVTAGQSTADELTKPTDSTGATDPTGTDDPTADGPAQRVRAAPLQTTEHAIEVVPRGGDATYLIEVTGTIGGANVDGREPNPTDEIREHTVVGQVVAGFQGDSYRYTGEIASITLLEGDAEFRRDGEVVDPAQFDGEQTEHVLEIAPGDTDASYEVAVSGTIEAADVNGRDVNPDDRVGDRSVEGHVSAGFDGDSYLYTGEIVSIALTDGNPMVLRDGEAIDPARFDGNGSTAPSIEFVNCTAARVTGDYAEIEFSGHWNVRDGVSTGLLSLSREAVRNRSGVVSSTEFWGDASVGGTVLDGVTVYDEDFDVLAEATRTNDDCSRRLRPEVTVSVADVRRAGSGTYEVTFAYANDHDEPLYYGPKELRGSVADGARNRLPDEFAPGEHAFTVTWTPASEDERLTWWIGANGSFAGVDEPLTARTEPAAAYGGGNGSGGDGNDANASADASTAADGSPAAESPTADASTADASTPEASTPGSQTDGSGTTGGDSDATATPEAATGGSDEQGTTDRETTTQKTPTEASGGDATGGNARSG